MPDQSQNNAVDSALNYHGAAKPFVLRPLGLFMVAVVSGLLAGGLLSAVSSAQNAQAQGFAPAAGSADGVMALTGKLTDDSYGLFIIDSNRKTVAVYEYVNTNSGRQLQLRAARNFQYDTKLSQYNTSPSPAEIAELVSQDTAVVGH